MENFARRRDEKVNTKKSKIKQALKKSIKTALSVIMSLQFVLSGSNVFAAEGEIDYALAYFDREDTFVNMSIPGYIVDTVDIGGRLVRTSRGNQAVVHLYCNVADDFMYNLTDGTPVEITVEYYDRGTGNFTLDYDSHDYAAGGYAHTGCSDIVKLTNTNEWKTHTFHIEDMRMLNSMSLGSDFRVGTWGIMMGGSSDDVVFGSIKVEYADYLHFTETWLDSERPGNIFTKDDEIKLNQNAVNKTDKNVVTKYEYKLYDENNALLDEKTIEMILAPKETKVGEVAFENPKVYGLYSLEIKQTEYYEDRPDDIRTQGFSEGFSVSILLDRDEVNPHYGVAQQIFDGRGDADITTKLMSQSGMTWMRDDFKWNTHERADGTFAMNEGELEKIKIMRDNGINLLFILGNYTTLPSGGNAPATDEEIEQYAKFCGWAAGQLKDLVDHFEIWNEYNIAAFNWNNQPPEQYAKMLKAAYAAIKEANPDAVVFSIDTADIDISWTKRVFDAGGYEYCDAVSVHPYDWSGDFREGRMILKAQELKELMSQYGEMKPLWGTEIGFSTFTGETGYTRIGQAAASIRMNTVNRAYGLYDVITQYSFHDRARPEHQEYNWGLVNCWDDPNLPNNGAKESYLAIAAHNYFCGGNTYVKNMDSDIEARCYVVDYYNERLGKDAAVLFSAGEATVKSYNLGCRSVDVYDLFGNKMATVVSDDGVYTFSINDIPYYVVGNFTKFEKTDTVGTVKADSVRKVCAPDDEVEFNFTLMDKSKKLTLQVEEINGVKVLENTGFVNGVAKVVLETSAEVSGDKIVAINAVDENGNAYYSTEHILEIEAPIEINVKAEEAVPGSKTHWRAVVEVKNVSQARYLNGSVSITEPLDVAEIAVPREFINLAPGAKTVFLFNLPERIVKPTVDLEVTTTLSNGLSYSTTQSMDFATAIYAKNKPKIDGVVTPGEWIGSWIGAKEMKDIRENINWAGPMDLSFSGTVMWDDENFYLMSIVTDDIYSTNYEPQLPQYTYRGDNIQFGLDERIEINSAETSEINELSMGNLEGWGDLVYRHNSYHGLPKNVQVENVEICIKRYDTYTVFEAAIPFEEIFYEGFKVDTSRPYRFSVMVNENDGVGRKGWIQYTSGIGSYKDVTEFGTIRFIK